MNVLDLFSGIGGFSLGLERAGGGFKTAAFCEIDPYCRKVLQKHWPDVPIYDDIRKLDGGELDDIGLICGGYPCQPFSQAGKRGGEEDDRHLWPEMYRLIKTLRPRWVVAENVAGHISMGLDAVLSDLETENYTCWPFVIPACAVDARHRRDRVWIVANSNSGGFSESDFCREQPRGTETVSPSEVMADSSEPGLQGHAGDESDRHQSGRGEANQAGSIAESRFCSRESAEWPTEPDVGRVAHGIPDRVDRLKALGNAVVPQIPEIIGRAIMEIEQSEKVSTSLR